MDAPFGASPECVVRRRCVGGAWRVARGGSGIVVRAAGGEPAALVLERARAGGRQASCQFAHGRCQFAHGQAGADSRPGSGAAVEAHTPVGWRLRGV